MPACNAVKADGKRCKAYCKVGDSKCIFHSKTVSDKIVAAKRKTISRDKIGHMHVEAFDKLFRTQEGRNLLKSELKAEVRQKALAVPMGIGLSYVSWRNPGYFHQRLYDFYFRSIMKATYRINPALATSGLYYVGGARQGKMAGHLLTKSMFETQLTAYLGNRYKSSSRLKRATVGGTARVLNKLLIATAIADTMMTSSKLASYAYAEALPSGYQTEDSVARTIWLSTIAGG